jgi:hypothetical protein
MENMRDMLRHTLRQSLRAMTPADRLAAAWPIACGRALAERGEIVAFADGALTVQVADSTWLQQFNATRSILQHDLQKIAGVPITAIHFELKR